jgi:hypothetical protein
MRLLIRILLVLAGLGAVGVGVWVSWHEGGLVGVVFSFLVVTTAAALIQLPLGRARRAAHALLWLLAVGYVLSQRLDDPALINGTRKREVL